MGDHILLVIDAFSGGDRIDPQFVQIDRVVFPDPETPCSAVCAGDDEVDVLFLFELCQSALHAEYSGRAHDFTDIEDSQGCTNTFPGNGGPGAKDTKESSVVEETEEQMDLDNGGGDLLFSWYRPGW